MKKESKKISILSKKNYKKTITKNVAYCCILQTI